MNTQVTRPAESEAALTADRDALKYRLPAGASDLLLAALSRRLLRQRPAAEPRDPRRERPLFITTVYFDTPGRHQFLAHQEAGTRDLKLRVREYCNPNPQPILWLELKCRTGIRTGKRRLGIPRQQVPRFMGCGQLTPEMIRIQQAAHRPADRNVLREVADYCARFPQPVAADCLVNYRRLAWQDVRASLRVTMDLDLACFRPPPDLWSNTGSLMRHRLGRALAHEASVLVEVKSRELVPAWLEDLLAGCGAALVVYSKFDVASRAVHR